jgi:uracil-DNA glycosylase
MAPTYNFRPFIERLAHAETAPDAYNQFGAGDDPYNAIRRANLERFLNDVYARQPKYALIGEAPGYKGMRLSGVPLMGRRMLLNGIQALGMFGTAQGYQDVPEPGFDRIQSEQSGTIAWGMLAELGIVPIVWAAFPFHPHELGEPLTNRAPRRSEVKMGASFLLELLEIFKPQKVIAFGNVGYGSLTELGVPSVKIRHPARGGKNDFVAGLRREAGL